METGNYNKKTFPATHTFTAEVTESGVKLACCLALNLDSAPH